MESKGEKKIASPSYITEEILQEILVYLPVKSLIRLKSVCKSWRSLILSRSFIDSHRLRHRRDHSKKLLVSPYLSTRSTTLTTALTDDIKLVRTQLDPALRSEIARQRYKGDNFRLLGPLSNGVYCMIGKYSIALCNPATKDHYKLTTASAFPPHLKKLVLNSAGRMHYGFGTFGVDDYKVVVVVNEGLPNSSLVSFVYSMQRGTWRKNADFECRRPGRNYPEIFEDLEVCPQRLLKGCWHWMAEGGGYEHSVLSYNFGDESFRIFGGTPSGYRRYHWKDVLKRGVLVLNDHLAAIYLLRPGVWSGNNGDFDVWMMMEYGVEESWTKIYSIKPARCLKFGRLVGISIRDDDDGGNYCIQRILFYECFTKELVSFDDTGIEKHGIYDISSSICWNTLGVSTYIETLEPLNPPRII